jgi:hypothetical protein
MIHIPAQGLPVNLLSILLVVAAALGCGESETRVPVHRVKGMITFQGQPISGAFLSLHPKSAAPDVPAPRASVNPDGSFELSTFEGSDGAPEGKYFVTVKWYKPVKVKGEVVSGPNALPAKFSNPKTSGIEVTVASGQNELPTIQLKR